MINGVQDQRKSKIYNINIDVFCTCLMPDTYGDIVQCESYHKWFSAKCFDLSHIPIVMHEKLSCFLSV